MLATMWKQCAEARDVNLTDLADTVSGVSAGGSCASKTVRKILLSPLARRTQCGNSWKSRLLVLESPLRKFSLINWQFFLAIVGFCRSDMVVVVIVQMERRKGFS